MFALTNLHVVFHFVHPLVQAEGHALAEAVLRREDRESARVFLVPFFLVDVVAPLAVVERLERPLHQRMLGVDLLVPPQVAGRVG